LAGPLLAALPRLGLPLVVGEIAAGVLLGRTGLGWIDAGEPTTAFLAEVGFAMLMFVVGTRLPLRDPALRNSVRPAALAALLTLAFAVPAGFGLALVGPDRPLVLAVIVATSSAAVALPILQGGSGSTATGDSTEGVAGGPVAAFAIGWITLTDVSTMLAVPLVLATGGLGNVLAGAGLVLIVGGAAFLPLRWLRRTDRVHALRRKSKHRGWALDLRVGLARLFGLAALATAAGASILVAGFTAGAVLAAVGEPRRLAQQLVGVAEGFLVPLFLGDPGRATGVRCVARLREGAAAARRVGRRRINRARSGRDRAAAAHRRWTARDRSARCSLRRGVDRPGPGCARRRAGRRDRQRRARGHRRVRCRGAILSRDAGPTPR
jgi:Kef-type K+ transport system membrane component KefB